jgi:hypothetical protein
MLYNALQLTLPFVELLLLMGVSFYLISLSYSWMNGAPYVGTQSKEIYEILKKINPQKNLNFVELGCGDGRVVKTAVKQFHLCGTGIDINPFLVWFCKISAKMQGIKNINFYSKNVLYTDLSNADIIYIFLFPALVKKLQNKILHETKKNVIIIAHGFKISYLENYLFDSRQGTSFKTYYYRKK